jgi:hypothetical protein
MAYDLAYDNGDRETKVHYTTERIREPQAWWSVSITFCRMFYHWFVAKSKWEDHVLEAAEQREREKLLETRLASVFVHVKEVVTKLRAKEKQLAVKLQCLNRLSTTVTGAYVVFNNEHTRTCVLDDYRTSTQWLARTLQPHPLRFCDVDGRCYPLRVTPAPAPDAIIWENVVDTTRLFASLALSMRWLVGLAVLFVAVAIPATTVAIATHERAFLASIDDDGGVCEQLPASFYGTYELPEGVGYAYPEVMPTPYVTPQYEPSDYSPTPYFNASLCQRPRYCDDPEQDVYRSVDCDGDGILDHVCTSILPGKEDLLWLVLSTEACPRVWGVSSRTYVRDCPVLAIPHSGRVTDNMCHAGAASGKAAVSPIRMLSTSGVISDVWRNMSWQAVPTQYTDPNLTALALAISKGESNGTIANGTFTIYGLDNGREVRTRAEQWEYLYAQSRAQSGFFYLGFPGADMAADIAAAPPVLRKELDLESVNGTWDDDGLEEGRFSSDTLVPQIEAKTFIRRTPEINERLCTASASSCVASNWMDATINQWTSNSSAPIHNEQWTSWNEPRCETLACVAPLWAGVGEIFNGTFNVSAARYSRRKCIHFAPKTMMLCHCKARLAREGVGGALKILSKSAEFGLASSFLEYLYKLEYNPMNFGAVKDEEAEIDVLLSPNATVNQQDACTAYAQRYIIVQQLQMIAGIAIFLFNFVLVKIIRWITTDVERHSCHELKVASFTSKLFACEIVNTVMLLLLINAPLLPSSWSVSDIFADGFGMKFAGALSDFDRRWYYGNSGVGAGLMTSIALFCSMPFLLTLSTAGGWFLGLIRLSLTPIDISLCLPQRTFTQIIALPTLDHWHHVQGTIHLAVLTIGLAFCGSMPLLLPLMAVYCVFAYVLTKTAALRLVDVSHWVSSDPLQPTQVGNGCSNGGGFGLWSWVPGQSGSSKSTPDRIIKTLITGLVIHLCMSVWMYSSPDIFDYSMANSEHGGYDGNALMDNEWDRKDMDSFTFHAGYAITGNLQRRFFYVNGREENVFGRNQQDGLTLITSGQRLQTVKDYACYKEGCRSLPEYSDPMSIAFYEAQDDRMAREFGGNWAGLAFAPRVDMDGVLSTGRRLLDGGTDATASAGAAGTADPSRRRLQAWVVSNDTDDEVPYYRLNNRVPEQEVSSGPGIGALFTRPFTLHVIPLTLVLVSLLCIRIYRRHISIMGGGFIGALYAQFKIKGLRKAGLSYISPEVRRLEMLSRSEYNSALGEPYKLMQSPHMKSLTQLPNLTSEELQDGWCYLTDVEGATSLSKILTNRTEIEDTKFEQAEQEEIWKARQQKDKDDLEAAKTNAQQKIMSESTPLSTRLGNQIKGLFTPKTAKQKKKKKKKNGKDSGTAAAIEQGVQRQRQAEADVASLRAAQEFRDGKDRARNHVSPGANNQPNDRNNQMLITKCSSRHIESIQAVTCLVFTY